MVKIDPDCFYDELKMTIEAKPIAPLKEIDHGYRL